MEGIRNIRLEKLIEREKELNCLYKVEAVLRESDLGTSDILQQIIGIIPYGWQFSTVCEARIIYQDREFKSPDFRETEWMQSTDIIVDENIVGQIQVVYTQMIRMLRGSQFLPEEQKLLNTIADRLGDYFFYKNLEKTIHYIESPGKQENEKDELLSVLSPESDEHWKWRMEMCRKIAERTNFNKYGIKAMYICGSTKNAEAGPSSDIDLIVHFDGDERKKAELTSYMNGWGMALSELNASKTGHEIQESLIDLHIITDEDIQNQDSFASMINCVHNSARLLKSRDN
ncbi:MAG: nucleotidyltransferase domain-containing protein [Bacteroidales bacterium]|nr:nucleotidyltransferase domain-containing protein [Bacteroidales bacterium]MCF8397017.1 nucleotidyltransferase domain-containing protein [Bacteroidales bacterium]